MLHSVGLIIHTLILDGVQCFQIFILIREDGCGVARQRVIQSYKSKKQLWKMYPPLFFTETLIKLFFRFEQCVIYCGHYYLWGIWMCSVYNTPSFIIRFLIKCLVIIFSFILYFWKYINIFDWTCCRG